MSEENVAKIKRNFPVATREMIPGRTLVRISEATLGVIFSLKISQINVCGNSQENFW